MIRKVIYRAIVMLAAVVSLGSCARVQEACGVVAEADSLRAVGQAFTGSVAIADAAEALYSLRFVYPTEYAHANYYYGRLLREHGDHPAAMEAFLRTVHSRTRDHAIKGRSWSNIANMCRLAAEHELAYDIYERSAEEFLLAQDSTNYYYVMNGKAYECAEMGDKERAFEIAKKIEDECNNPQVLQRVLETRAEACLKSQEYDSVLYYICQVPFPFCKESSHLLLRAQAFSYLNVYDSAVYYAKAVTQVSKSWFELNNAYYIISNYEENSLQTVLQIVGDRADIQKQLEIRQGQLSQATQLLQMELNRKPDLRWLIAIIATIIVIGIGIIVYVRKRKRQHQLYSQKAAAAQETHRTLSEQNQQLVQQQVQHKEKALAEIEIFCNSINVDNIKDVLCWKDYDQMCMIVNNRMFGLADKLKASGIKNPKQIQLCILVAIGKFRDKQMGDILCYADNTVRSSKKEAARKLGISGKNLRPYLLQMAIG